MSADTRRPKRVVSVDDYQTADVMDAALDRGLEQGYEVTVEVLPDGGGYRVWWCDEIDA